MFIAALLKTAKTWKEAKCPSTDEWVKMWYMYIHTYINIHTMEYYSAIKKDVTMSLAATGMDLDIVTLSEVRQGKTNI